LAGDDKPPTNQPYGQAGGKPCQNLHNTFKHLQGESVLQYSLLGRWPNPLEHLCMTHKLASFNIFETAHRHPGMPFQGAMLGAVPLDLKVGFIIQSAIFCRSTYIGATVLHQKPKQSFFGYLAFNTTSNLVCLTPLYTKSACVAHIHNCFDFFQSTLPEQSSSLWHLLNKTVPCPEKSVHAASALFTICLRSH